MMVKNGFPKNTELGIDERGDSMIHFRTRNDGAENIFKTLSNLLNRQNIKGYFSGSFALALEDPKNEFDDIDIFFETEEEFLKCVDLFKTEETITKDFQTENAITYKIQGVGTVQLICFSFKPIKDILSMFDFVHVMYAVDMNGTVTDLRRGVKTIKPNNLKNTSIKRLMKYIDRGFKITPRDFKTFIDAYTSGDMKPLYGQESEECSIDDLFRWSIYSISTSVPDSCGFLVDIFKTGWANHYITEHDLKGHMKQVLKNAQNAKNNYELNREQELILRCLQSTGSNAEYISEDMLFTLKMEYPEKFLADRTSLVTWNERTQRVEFLL